MTLEVNPRKRCLYWCITLLFVLYFGVALLAVRCLSWKLFRTITPILSLLIPVTKNKHINIHKSLLLYVYFQFLVYYDLTHYNLSIISIVSGGHFRNGSSSVKIEGLPVLWYTGKHSINSSWFHKKLDAFLWNIDYMHDVLDLWQRLQNI